jgi:drug/metabolite transporter (DMT)-like permease
LLGTLLSFAAAAFFGLNATTVRRGVLTGSVLQGITVSLGLGLPIFIIASIFAGSFSKIFAFSTEGYFLLITGGAIHFAFARYCNYRAMKAMGGLMVRPFQQSSVIVSLVLAMFLLGETLTPLRLFGIILVLLGPLIMIRDRKKFSRKMKQKNEEGSPSRIEFVPNYTEGIIFGIGSAFGLGASPVFTRAVIGNMDLTTGIAAGAISYGSGALIILLIMTKPSRIRDVLSMSRTSFNWFSLSALFITLSQILRFMALAVAPVTVVSPIQQTTAIFQVIFTRFINPDHEAMGKWVLLGILSSFIGAIALSVSTEFVLAHVDLPDAIVKFAGWRWP